MAKITAVEIIHVNLQPKTRRTDAVQSFELQETPIVRLTDADEAQGVGTGGRARSAASSTTILPPC